MKKLERDVKLNKKKKKKKKKKKMANKKVARFNVNKKISAKLSQTIKNSYSTQYRNIKGKHSYCLGAHCLRNVGVKYAHVTRSF